MKSRSHHIASPRLTRRRAIYLFASALSAPSITTIAVAGEPISKWQGTALGGDASIVLEGFSAEESNNLFAQATAELLRLEQIFSLYVEHSSINQLNDAGQLASSPPELVAALNLSADLHRQSQGAFDPTVQPLWELFARQPTPGMSNTDSALLDATLARIGFEHVHMSGDHIKLHNEAKVTLNGIAQGIITDHIAALFEAAGAKHTLVNLGEFHAIGPKRDGSSWRIALRDPASSWRMAGLAEIEKGALATSANALDYRRAQHHLFDPRTGYPASHYTSVSVVAPSAALADGLSTALFALPPVEAFQLISQYEETAARFTLVDGQITKTDLWHGIES